MTQTRTQAAPPIAIRPKKGSALERLVDTAKSGGRGAVSDLIHGLADRAEQSERVKREASPAAFD